MPLGVYNFTSTFVKQNWNKPLRWLLHWHSLLSNISYKVTIKMTVCIYILFCETYLTKYDCLYLPWLGCWPPSKLRRQVGSDRASHAPLRPLHGWSPIEKPFRKIKLIYLMNDEWMIYGKRWNWKLVWLKCLERKTVFVFLEFQTEVQCRMGWWTLAHSMKLFYL